MTPSLNDCISESEFIIFGAGPVGLAIAQYLKLQDQKFVLLSLPDHLGVENQLNYGTNLNSEKKIVGGIGGTARNWGAQCGYFSEMDYDNWEKFELGTNFSKTKFEEAINECNSYLKISKPDKNEFFLTPRLSKVSTIYPKQKNVKKIFKNLLSSVEIHYINKIEKYLESRLHHIIILEDKNQIKIDKKKKIIFALGGLCNLNLYTNSDFLIHEKKSLIAVYDHLSFYPIEIETEKNPFEFSDRIKKKGIVLNKKIYFNEEYSRIKLVQQGVAEIHPVYSWKDQKQYSKFVNFLKRALNFVFYNIDSRIRFLPGRYRIFMQIEQNYEIQRYTEITRFNGLNLTKKDSKFIENFIMELSNFLNLNELNITNTLYIDNLYSPTLFQAFHPSSVFLYPEKGNGQPQVNFLGMPLGAKNIHFVGSCMFPTPGWVNPTLMAMSHAVYVAQELVSD